MILSKVFKNLLLVGLISLIISTTIVIALIKFSPKTLSDFDFYSSHIDEVKDVSYASNMIYSYKVPNSPMTYKIHTTDFRGFVFDEYFKRKNSPLYGLGSSFVKICDKYGAPRDCTAVVAIAAAETDSCNYPPSQLQKNCWGFGGSGENRRIFANYEEGIDTVTYALVFKYGHKYMIDPNAMEMTFCGNRPSCAVWGERVQEFMDRLDKLSTDMGYPSLYSLRIY